jgi:hypothetical protein
MKCVKTVIVYDNGVPGVSQENIIKVYDRTVEARGLEYAQNVYPELAEMAKRGEKI